MRALVLLQDGATADEKHFSKNFQFLSLGAMAYIGEHGRAANLQSRQTLVESNTAGHLQDLNTAYMLRMLLITCCQQCAHIQKYCWVFHIDDIRILLEHHSLMQVPAYHCLVKGMSAMGAQAATKR